MVPTLIVLGLLALGVVIVVLATRRHWLESPGQSTETDTAWNDEFTPPEPAAADPFQHAPTSTASVQPDTDRVERP